jgi:iron only hydrogenase large subunit-like protein
LNAFGQFLTDGWVLFVELSGVSLMTSLLLGDLNDYIQPSVACIKPEAAVTASSVNKPVEINLNDCLACSGCITSAETVLVAEQTHHQFYAVLDANRSGAANKTVVVSICPSTRTALARRFKLTSVQVYRRLLHFFRRTLGVSLVLDINFASTLVMEEAAREFIHRYRDRIVDAPVQPVLVSECPGWVCYAEKKQPGLLPHLSTVRSPQQMMGALVKSYLLEKILKVEKTDVYHVSIMSCYDKKLEAARTDFADPEGVRDVDCVITTNELLTVIEDKSGGAFESLPEAQLEEEATIFKTWTVKGGIPQLTGPVGNSAGGYLFYVMRRASKEIFNIDLPVIISSDPRIQVHHHRNADYTEYTLTDGTSILLRFGAIYGFRNIQTFVQKSKTRKVEYDFVEVMACPGACLFGGGQPTPDTGKVGQEAFRSEMEALHADSMVIEEKPGEEVARIYEWINADPSRQSLFHTSFRPLEESIKKNPLINVQW